MIENTGAIDVYFEDEIQVLVEDPDLFDESAMEKTLAELEVKYTEIGGAATL